MEPSKDLKVFCNYRRLKEIKRCNNFPVINREDVAQHSYYVTLLAMAVADEYNDFAAEHNMCYHPYDVDNHMDIVKIEPLLRKALLHDTEEAFTSDIPWNVKHADEETHEVISRAIEKKINEVYDGTSTMECYHRWGTDCKQGFEGQFVDIVDMLELAHYCFEEVCKGNNYIKPLLKKSIRLVKSHSLFNVLNESSALFRTLVELLECENFQSGQLLDID